MANEAFALSPMSARPVEPGEAEYAAISAAFMETSRGRWFLDEYARRNRNADTRLVLDAVARLEESLAAQRQTAAADDVDDTRLHEALTTIRGAVGAAQASVNHAFDGLALEQRLTPIRKGTRIIREISWRLREIGNDGRICDIIDSQLNAIEASAAEITADETRALIDTAFASIAERLAEYGDVGSSATVTDATPPASSEAAAVLPTETAAAESLLEPLPPDATAPATAEAEIAPEAPLIDATALATEEIEAVAPAIEATVPEIEAIAPEVEEITAAVEMPETVEQSHDVAVAEISFDEGPLPTEELEAAEAGAPVADVTDEVLADTDDEAILDLIANEMGAPDPIEDDEALMPIAEAAHLEPQPSEVPATALAPEVELEVVAAPQAVEPAPQTASAAQPVPQPLPEFQPALERSPEPEPASEPNRETPAAELSLGASIIASGLFRKPQAANDPLAPIRRMSQAEKVAFFS